MKRLITLFIALISFSGYCQVAPTGTLSALSTTYGTASSETNFSFSASGIGATETVTVTPPAGFEVSLTSGSGFAATVTRQASGGNISATTVYVRLKATSAAATYTGNITLTGDGGAATQTIATASSTVNQKALTITGASASNKPYDGTTTATITASPTLNGVLAGDVANVSINAGATGTFASANTGTGITVTSNYSLTGTAAGNYSLTQPTLTADITAIALTITGATASDKIYNGNNSATVTASPTLNGVLAGDVANVSISAGATGTFASTNVGTGIAVTSNYSLTGSAAGNYTVTQPALTADITVKALTLTGASATNKTYNGNNSATITASPTLNGVVAADVANVAVNAGATGTFASPNVGAGIAVTSNYSLTGTAAGNYSLTQPTLTADITAIALTITGASASNKVYDKTTTGSVTASPTLNGVLAGDAANVSLNAGATGTFASSNVGTGIAVTSNYSLTGSAAGNYTVTQPTLTANITAIALTITGASASNKVYDKTTTGSVTASPTLNGVLAGDGANVSVSAGATGTFASANVGSGIAVTSNYSLTGSASGNYTVTQPTLTANITPKNLTITGVTAVNKVFNGNTTGSLTGTAALLSTEAAGTGSTSDGKPYTGDVLSITGAPTATFASAATIAGATGVAVTVTGYTLGGAQAGNYSPVQPTGLTATIYAGEPTGQSRNITFSAVTAVSMTITWVGPSSGTPGSNKLVLVRDNGTVNGTPTDFTSYTASADWASKGSLIGTDNYVVYNGTANTFVLTNLDPNTTYNVQVFDFNGAPASGLENYYTVTNTNNPKGQATNNADNTATFTSGSGASTIAATANTSGAAVALFQFVASDLSGDGVSTRFTQLVFKAGAGNQISNWTQLIAGAELSDNAGHTSALHGPAVIATGPNTITIPGISAGGSGSTPSDLGTIAEGTTRTYTLKVWLKTSLGGTLPATVDNLRLEFAITGADVTAVPSKGAFASGTTTSSGAANGQVIVTASSIRINQQPSSAATANVALSQQPIFEAIDANGNRDLLNNAITVGTSNGAIGATSAPANFVSGLADFTGSGFTFSNTGTTTMNVSISSPTLTSPNTNSITVTSSTNLGSSSAVLALSPLIDNSTLKPVLGFSINTGGSITNLTDLVFTSTLAPAGYVKNFKLYSNTSADNFAGATQVAISSTLTFSGMSIPVNSTPRYFFLVCDVEPFFPTLPATIQFSLPAANFTVASGGLKTGSTQTGTIYSFSDLTAPDILSIVTASTTNPLSTTKGTSAGTVQFTVTFTEPVSGVANSDFRVVTDGTVSSALPTQSGSGSVYTVTVGSITGNGHLRIELEDNNTITDHGGNFFKGPGITDYFTDFVNTAWYYSIVLPRPGVPAGFGITSVNLEIYINYLITHSAGNPATHYLVMARESLGATAFPTISDGMLIADDNYDGAYGQFVGDGVYITNVTKSGPASQAGFIDGLKSGVNYDFIVYPYTKNSSLYSDDNILYGTPASSNNYYIPTASNSTLNQITTSGTILSTVDTAPEAQTVYQFSVTDRAGSGYESAPTRFSGLTIKELIGLDNVTDWSVILDGAELFDIASPTTSIGAASIIADQITFTGIPSAITGDLGYIPRSSTSYSPYTTNTKTYGLRVYFKPTSGALNGNDKKVLAFRVTASDFTYATPAGTVADHQASTTIQAGTASSGANTIDVVASKLLFTTNLPDKTGVKHPFAVAPVVEARDVNDNVDIDFTGATVSLSNAAMTFTNPDVFSSGKLTLANFTLDDPGLTKVIVAKAGVTSATSASPTGPAGNTEAVISGYTSVLSTGTPSSIINSIITFAPGTLPSAGQQNATSLANFSFIIKDDDGVPAAENDLLPTRISSITINQNSNNGSAVGGAFFDDWQNSIAGAQLSVGGVSVGGTVTINSNSIAFDNIPNTTSAHLGYITDDLSRTYLLRIWLKNPIDSDLQDILDGEDFVFGITNASDLTLTSATGNHSSTLNTISAFHSGNGNNAVEVSASKIDFTTEWLSSADQSYDTPLDADALTAGAQSPSAKARDINGNLDRGYTTGATIATADASTYPLLSNAVTVNNGIITFNPSLRVGSSGGGLNGATTNLIITSGSLNGSSNSFVLNYSKKSDVILDAGFSHTLNIPYATANNQVTDITSGNGVAMEQFIVRDGGGAGDADGTVTKVSSIVLNINNYHLLRRVALYDGSTEVADLDVASPNITPYTATNADMTFSGLNFVVPDDDATTRKLTVKVSFLSSQIAGFDNSIIEFQVKSITAAAVSSSFVSGASTLFPTLGPDDNKVEVVATKIDFTTQPISASVSVPVSPQIIVSARDINANLDIDFISGVIITGNIPVDPGPFVTANDPASGDLFNAGQLTYPANFQFTVGDGDVRLTITAGSISGTSAVISSLTSYDSWLYFDPTFGYAPKIDFANKQEDPTTTTSQILGRLILSDGGSATSIATFDPTPFNPLDDALYNPQRGVKNQINHGDSDGAFTRISDFTISLSNFQDIRKIALYASDGVTQIGTDKTPAATVTFNNIGDAHKAPDNGIYTFYIRASFKTTVTDLDQIAMQVTAVTHHSGSKFSEQLPVSPPATIAGVDGATTFGDSSPLTVAGVPVNVLDVIATSLDFTHQANPPYAGINEPVGKVSPLFTVPYVTAPLLPSTDAAIVSARDKFANLDTEFNYAPTITQTAGPNTPISAPRSFISGILRLDGIQYQVTGDGTLKVIANGIDSSTPASGTHIPGQLVNVVHVSVLPATAGVLSTPNIKGGTPNAVLFGVTFTPDFSTTSEPNLKKFVFSFDDFYATSSSTILKNFRVTESLSAAFSGSTDVTLSSAIVTTGSSTNSTDLDLVIVDWGSNPSRPLFDITTGAPVSRSYFLVADVDVSANIGTPNLTPQLVDGGYISSSTDAHIVTSAGTATSNVIGQKYQFASTRPPVLKANLSSPFNGQLNVDAGLTEIDLVFDVQVWSLDGVGELFSRTNNKKVANLNAINGNYVDLSTPAVNPLRFSINFLPGESFQPDEVYYVTIKKGSFNNNNNTGSGISDNGFNFYGGISSNATLYFKISSLNPPNLISAKSYFGNGTTASFSTNFDQAGTAHYMVLPTGSSAPSAAQIRNPVTYPGYPVTVTAADSYAITQVNTFQTVSFSAALSVTTYDVWIVSENDAIPTHKATAAPYGSSAVSFAVGGAGPTLKITVPTPAPIRSNNFPTYSVCPDSYTTLSEPIIIGEPAAGTFNSGSTLQTFYILLPTGFQFDGVTEPTVSLNGADFDQSSLNVDFENNTLLEISYRNTTSTTIDNIVITGLKVKGTSGSSLGYIKRFAGNANLGGASQLATIFLATAQIHTFTNSYSKDNDFTPFGFSSLDVITAIPDNYVDKDATLTGAIRLQPTITAANDYGASFFTGNGVTNDVLSLSAVTVDAAFDITMTHTDPNGCTSESSVQYVVYDHKSPVSIKLGQSLGGTQQSLVNPNFPNQTPAIIFPNSTSPQINYNELAGYNLIKLFATIPTNAGTQIISGPDWKNQIAKIPVVKTQYPTSNIPGMPPGTGFYRDYQWDYNHILNAVSESQLDNPSTSIIKDPYDNFKVIPTGKAPYWTGGSLGKIEFVGTYQSTADFTVLVPFKQQVELFVPPIPVVEVDQSNQPVKGTAIYCEAGGGISITGYPQASAASSTGIFSLTTSTGIPLVVPSGAFIDNGNGTATLFPNLFNNAYSDIKINYTYQDNNSPVSGVGSVIIKVAPNPVAKFTFASDLTASILDSQGVPGGLPLGKASAAEAYCAGIPIIFNPANSTIATIAGDNIASYNWKFGDNSSATNQSTSTVSNPIINNNYPSIGTYHAELTVVSDKGCASINADNAYDITVGSIPSVYFDMTGVSTTDQIVFTDKSTVSSNGSNSFSQIADITWDYGDGISNTTSAHQYTATGHFNVTSTVTTRIGANSGNVTEPGCSRSFERHIVILDKKTGFYEDDFESVTSKWQTIKDSLTTNASLAAVPSSWKRGTPSSSRAYIKATPVTGTANNNVWATGLTGTYLKNERSFLYSPSIDMTGFLRPMISFDANKALGKDGVVLEYSTDNLNVADPNKVWTTVGNNTTGVNWFNEQIIGSKPGKQSFGDFGWSGSSTNTDTPTGWMESKHELLNAISTPTNQRTNVVFRFSFATINDGSSNEAGTGSDGFAMDNFRIGERTRTILLENFTTTNAKDAAQISLVKSENSFISTFIAGGLGTTVVKLNYHIGFTGNDPFNLDNPADPSARALYYNVKNVPWAFLDGNRPAIATTDSRIESWAQKAYDSQTLQLGQAEITVPPFTSNPDGSIKFNVEVKALYDLPVNTVVHVAVIEQSILKTGLSSEQQATSLINTGEDNFDYVLKKMLPNALGTKLGALAKGKTPTIPLEFEYYPDPTKLYKNDNDLAIIVFLQNEDTKTIYQTEYITGITDPSSTITGVETPPASLEDVNLYPNPADHELTILLPRKAIGDITIQLFDQVGKSVLNSTIKNGEQKSTLNVQGLAESMYLMRLVENGVITMKKVVVVHN